VVDVSLAVLLTLAFSSPPHCVCRLGGSIFPRRAPFFSNRTGGATADRTLNEDSELASPPYTPIRRFIGGLASAAAGVVIIEAGRSRTTTTSTSTTRTQQPSSALPSVPQRPTKAHTNVRLTKKTPSSGIKYIGVSRAKTYALRDHTSLPRPLPLVRPIASHPPRLPSPAGRLSLGPLPMLRIHSPRPPSTLTAPSPLNMIPQHKAKRGSFDAFLQPHQVQQKRYSPRCVTVMNKDACIDSCTWRRPPCFVFMFCVQLCGEFTE